MIRCFRTLTPATRLTRYCAQILALTVFLGFAPVYAESAQHSHSEAVAGSAHVDTAANHSATPSLEAILETLQNTMGKVKSLSCRFVQRKTLAMFDDTLESEGLLVFQSPDRLRWEYTSPVQAGFVVAGDKGRVWNVLTNKDETFRVADNMEMRILSEQVMQWTTFNLEALRHQYHFAVVATSPVQLALTPKSQAVRQFLAELHVTLAADMTDVTRLEFIETDGDVTTYEFQDAVTNAAIDSALVTP